MIFRVRSKPTWVTLIRVTSQSTGSRAVVSRVQVRMLIHKDREGNSGEKKEPYSRVSMALKYRIKDFVTHPNCQQACSIG